MVNENYCDQCKKSCCHVQGFQELPGKTYCFDCVARFVVNWPELVDALRSALSACDIAKKRDPDQAGMYHCPRARETLAKYINPDDLL